MLQKKAAMASAVDENYTAPTSETDQRSINISHVHGNIMIGHNSKLLRNTDAYVVSASEDMGERMTYDPNCNVRQSCSLGHRARAQPVSGSATKLKTTFNTVADTDESIMGPLPPTPRNHKDQQIRRVGSEREKCLNREGDAFASTNKRTIQNRSRAQQMTAVEPERESCSYGCVYTGGSRHGPWCPTPNRRITNYPPKEKGTILENWEEFVQDLDGHLEKFPKVSEEERKSREQLLVYEVLPKIEESCTQDAAAVKAAVPLAKLGCTRISESVTTHALELLDELVSHNKLRGHADKLLLVEKIFRRSFLLTKSERKEKLERKVIIYSHILILMLMETEKNGHLFYFSIEEERELRKGVESKLEQLLGTQKRKKPDVQLSLDVVSEAAKRLFSTNNSVRKQHEIFLQEFTPLLEQRLDQKQTEEKWKQLQKRLSNTNNAWFDVVVLLHYINAQENMCPKNTVIMLCKLVNEYMTVSDRRVALKTKTNCRKNGVFLAAIAVLFEIAMIQKRADVRKDATLSLVNYRTSVSNPLVTEAVERYVGMCLFGRDTDAQKLLACNLFDVHNPGQEIPHEHVENYLKWFYRMHSLEMPARSASNTSNGRHFTRIGSFRGIPSVIKILKIDVKEISQSGTVASSKVQRDLINEAYSLNKLNAEPHPNILRVLVFNTAKPPYHVITEYIPKGTVREYLQSSWSENNFLPSQSSLIQICRDVTEAERVISGRKLVHRGLTADNIFIGNDGFCKVAGTTTVRPLRYPSKGSNASEEDTYLKPADNQPEYVSKEEDYPVTHAAPECIKEGRFSTASDVYAIGVLMWEVFTYGCPAYSRTKDGIRIPEMRPKIQQRILEGKKLPKEDYFHEEIYLLMESCWVFQQAERPSLDHLSQQFDQLRYDYSRIAEYDRPPANPPMCRLAGKLDRLRSPPSTPEFGLENLDFPKSSSLGPTRTKVTGEEPVYDNNATMLGLCKLQEMNEEATGYMPLIASNGGEYKSLTQSANPFPVDTRSGEQISSGKPPVPKKPQFPSAPRRVDTGDAKNDEKSPLLPNSQMTPTKTSRKGNFEIKRETDKIEKILDKNTTSAYQRVKSLGKQVLPAGFKVVTSGRGNTTVKFEACDDCVTRVSHTTLCHGPDTPQRDTPENEFPEDDCAYSYCEIADEGKYNYIPVENESSHIYNDVNSNMQRNKKGQTL